MSFDYIGYWDNAYKNGGNSGAGSYGVLAEFKAEVINSLIAKHQLARVIEFGCGDGNQLSYMNYKEYLGLDVAGSSIRLCTQRFASDPSKSFMLYNPGLFINQGFIAADLAVCLDVLYHITNEADYISTLRDLFSVGAEWVVLYTRITNSFSNSGVETIQDRNVFDYLTAHPEYKIEEIIPQRYPELSSADFLLLRKS
ncbi:class I SAM-dependent methyltransferase [Neobacillus mesonae]|nr:class I SAM-dependent methyltransferase [Neobacillus mesonae]